MQNMFVEISSLECERECVKYWSKEKERYKEVWRQGEVEIKRERLFDVGSLARKWKGGLGKGQSGWQNVTWMLSKCISTGKIILKNGAVNWGNEDPKPKKKKVVGTIFSLIPYRFLVTCQRKLAKVPFTRMTISNSPCFLLLFHLFVLFPSRNVRLILSLSLFFSSLSPHSPHSTQIQTIFPICESTSRFCSPF